MNWDRIEGNWKQRQVASWERSATDNWFATERDRI